MRHLCKWSALGICMVLALLTLLLVLPGLLGIHPLLVQSGSMEPEYPVGSMIYVKSTEGASLAEGDVATFYLPDEETLVTHRIIRVDGASTPFSMIVGTPILCIPNLGYLAGYLSSAAGKVGIILLVILVCLLSWMEGALIQEQKEAGSL